MEEQLILMELQLLQILQIFSGGMEYDSHWYGDDIQLKCYRWFVLKWVKFAEYCQAMEATIIICEWGKMPVKSRRIFSSLDK